MYHHKFAIHGDSSGYPELANPDVTHRCPHEGCDYSHKLRHNVVTHFTHRHGELKHICDQCGKKFRTPYTLKSHYWRNHGTDQLACEVCSKVFTNPESLRKHKEAHGEPKHVCSECGKSYIRSSGLRAHVLFAHSDVRRFVCDCGKAFKLFSHLIRHGKEKGHHEGRRYDHKMENCESVVFAVD